MTSGTNGGRSDGYTICTTGTNGAYKCGTVVQMVVEVTVHVI